MSPSSLTSRVRRVAVSASALLFATCTNDPIQTGADRLAGPMAAIGVDPESGATIETNKDDYQPGEVVHVEGRGWAPNETVVLFMTEEPDTHDDVTQEVQADGDGKFSIHFYDVQPHDLGVTFTLTATGQISGSVATAIFTDGNLNDISISPPSVTVTTGSSAAYTITIDINGNASDCPVTLSVVGTLPTGAVAVFGGGTNPVNTAGPAGLRQFARSLTISTTVATPVGTYPFLVRGTEGTGCQSTGGIDDASGELVVAAAPNAAPVLDPIGDKTVPEETQLSFSATATDENVPTLQFTLANPTAGTFPTGAVITTAGAFTWTPTEEQGPGTYRVKVVVTDNGSLTDDEEIEITVIEVNLAPVLDPIGNQSVNEGDLLSFTATATDPDLPANGKTFSLEAGAPAGAAITAAGAFTWTPTEAQGPGVYPVTIKVTDDGTPNLSDTETIQITVNEVNAPPVLDAIGNKTIDEGVELTFAASATDPDLPANSLTFSLDAGAPSGAAITPAGVFTWTPGEADGPGNFNITVRVTDNGTPALSDFETIQVTVNEANIAPELAPIGDKEVDEKTLLTFTATATDADLPPNTLTFSLDAGAPAGAAITAGGVFTWTPTETQGPGMYPVTVRVTDNGVPAKSDYETINITVNEVNEPPVLAAIGNQMVDEEVALTFTATATDPDVPANGLTFTLGTGAPAGASINASGSFSWTPTEAQGPGTYPIKVVVTDNGNPQLSDYEIISVEVREVNKPPVLAAIGNKTIDEGSLLTFTATATDPDLPANSLTFSLDAGAPTGAGITSGGVFTWTPPNGPGSFNITVRVTDNGSPALSDYETITVTVNNVAPVITSLSVPMNPVPLGSPVNVTWNFSDPGVETWACSIKWDNVAPHDAFQGASYVASKSCSATSTTLPAGVYTVTARVADDVASDEESASAYIVVYDPSGGFVTGGGWIMTQAGSYPANPAASGKATFGFVSKYLKGATTPSGNTEFQFQAGDLNFKSTSYQWLVVSGPLAQYKGEGSINGTGRYGFLLTARDGQAPGGGGYDKFRIKIWDFNDPTVVVYDNQLGTAEDSDAATILGGGSIVVHAKK